MICRHGGLTFVRHNALRNITAEWLSKTCHGVALEPPLQPLTGEIIAPKTANRQDEARADIATTYVLLTLNIGSQNWNH